MECGHQEISRPACAVAGKDTAGAVGAMAGRCEPDDEHARARIAEAGNRARPVGVLAKGAALLLADASTVAAQARAALARHDPLARTIERGAQTIASATGKGCAGRREAGDWYGWLRHGCTIRNWPGARMERQPTFRRGRSRQTY